MKEDNPTYTSRELLENDHFISSMLDPLPESNEYFDLLANEGFISCDELKHARHFMQIMQEPKKVMTAKERTELWVKIEIQNKKILRNKLKKRRIYLYGAVASLFIALFSIGYFLLRSETHTVADFQHIMAGLPDMDNEAKEIQLILSDNKKIELNEKNVDIVLQEGGEILVNSKKLDEKQELQEEKSAVTYNQLIVPFGRHSSLTLSDGTKLYINSGSKVVFPHHFKKEEREIFVDGEVYLEVVQNKDVPFYVRTNYMDIKVLGTSFNVCAYKKDAKQAIVLVSGSVSVKAKDKYEAKLFPNQMLSYSSAECAITSVDVNEYISWKDGYFIYKNEPVVHVMKQLSRYYGTSIVCDPEITSITCTGKLDLKEDLNKVLTELSDVLRLELLLEGNRYRVKKR